MCVWRKVLGFEEKYVINRLLCCPASHLLVGSFGSSLAPSMLLPWRMGVGFCRHIRLQVLMSCLDLVPCCAFNENDWLTSSQACLLSRAEASGLLKTLSDSTLRIYSSHSASVLAQRRPGPALSQRTLVNPCSVKPPRGFRSSSLLLAPMTPPRPTEGGCLSECTANLLSHRLS